MKVLKIIALTLACVLLACLPLQQFAGEGGFGIGGLALALILATFAYKLYELKNNTNKVSFFEELKSQIQLINKLDLAVLALLLAAFIATISSYFVHESLSGLIKYFLYFLIYCCFRLLVQSREDSNMLILASFVGLTWVCLEGLEQVFGGAEELATWEDPNIDPSQHLTRVYSTLLNPNLLAGYLLAMWPLSLIGLKHLDSKDHKNNLLVFFSLALGALALYLTLQTGSRGAWIALLGQLLLLGLAILIFFPSRILVGVFGLGISGSLVFLLSKQKVLNRVLSIFSSYDHSSNSFRLHVWQACLKIIQDNPIFGIGPGSKAFYLAYGIYMDANYSALGAYSLLLEIGVEMGLLGLATLAFLIFTIAQEGFQFIQKAKNLNWLMLDRERFLIVIAVLISLAGLLIDGLFDIVILRPQVQIVLWLLLATLSFHLKTTQINTNG
jgi:putative inorganic carbon (HCO3(-)) transporter